MMKNKNMRQNKKNKNQKIKKEIKSNFLKIRNYKINKIMIFYLMKLKFKKMSEKI